MFQNTRKHGLTWLLLLLVAAFHAVATAQAPLRGQVVKLAWIDPLSGLMGPVGANQLKTFQFAAEKTNLGNPAGVRFELVTFDNKLSPAESLNALKAATDQGIRYVVQGNGSAVAGALIDAVNKHNERNPGQEVLLLNHSAVDPDLTNSKCSYWHFRFDADTSMKMEVMTSYMKEQPGLRSIYLINQNYSHGQQVARYAKDMLAHKRPDVKVVGEDLHPLAQVRDFAPYVAKIKASGADAVITGNWGSDLSLLIKAAQEANYTGKFYTYYANVTGTPTALGRSGAGQVYSVVYSHYNMGGQPQEWMNEFKARFNDDMYTHSILHLFSGLTAAMQQARSTEPLKVAAALSGLKFNSFNGEVEMRRSDHQLQQPLYMLLWNPTTAAHPYSPENTGMTFVPTRRYDAYVASTPTSCQMKRPG
ncbi:MAG: branched-chain amino acid ABC transporter substrate-binding protein [Burkholderiales bacterium]